MMSVKLDEKDRAILVLIQENSKLTAKQIAKKINAPITTVFAKTKRMEALRVLRRDPLPFQPRRAVRHPRLGARADTGIGYRDFHVNLAQESAHYYQNAGTGLPPEARRSGTWTSSCRRKGRPRGPVDSRAATRAAAPVPRDAQVPPGVPGRSRRASSSTRSGTSSPCSMWDARLGNLRETGFQLAPIWDSAATRARRREIVAEKCPHCWTPCEAYQTILCNLAACGRNG